MIPELRGCCITVTGWTLEYVNAMAFPDILELWGYWAKFPPVHLAVRAFLKPADAEDTGDDIGSLEQIPHSAARRSLHSIPRNVRDWMMSEKVAHG